MIKKKDIKIAVGVSGGVDSAVSLYLLKKAGYTVTAVFLDCWQKNTGCDNLDDRKSALQVATLMDVPFRVLDFRDAYRQKVLDYFFSAYSQNITPNPDIMCNQKIKFGLFLDYALNEMKMDAIATGHYARVRKKKDIYQLLTGKDQSKDQSYFLYTLNQSQLSHTFFPIGHLPKKKVRQIAKKAGLLNWNRPDSQGICFVGKVDLPEFLKKRIETHPGKVLNEKGKIIGNHQGVHLYTIGQRHGFQISHYQGIPLYVIAKNEKDNLLTVGPREKAFSKEIRLDQTHFICQPPKPGKYRVRIRHLGEMIPASVERKEEQWQIYLKKPVFGLAQGQSAVIYDRSVVLGGGVIV